jgi:hypothetical protein
MGVERHRNFEKVGTRGGFNLLVTGFGKLPAEIAVGEWRTCDRRGAEPTPLAGRVGIVFDKHIRARWIRFNRGSVGVIAIEFDEKRVNGNVAASLCCELEGGQHLALLDQVGDLREGLFAGPADLTSGSMVGGRVGRSQSAEKIFFSTHGILAAISWSSGELAEVVVAVEVGEAHPLFFGEEAKVRM